MDRRNFLCKVTASAAGGAVLRQPAHAETQRVKYAVKGFTCITCAVGLEVMLRGLKGVASASASYPENQVVISYDAHVIAEDKIREFIRVCGFSVAGPHA
jgi:copper chaperone CopZ